MDDSFLQNARMLEDILAHDDSFTVMRLMQAYETSPDKIAFVAALIGRLMMQEKRKELSFKD
jgi:hypothetical protein